MNHRNKETVIWRRVVSDAQYMILNHMVNRIPCWWMRKKLYIKMGMVIGQGARIGTGTVVLNPPGIKIGAGSVINENCLLDGRGGLVIGRETSISTYTKILSASHKSNGQKFDYYIQKTRIGNYVWIGTDAIVLDGSIIKDYAIVGAGAVLKGKTQEGDILIGNPAVCIKKRKVSQPYQLKYKAYFR